MLEAFNGNHPLDAARQTAQQHFRTLRLPSPFQPRIEALARTEEWYNWAGYKAPQSLWDEELEFFAIRSQAAVFDISPMVKYRIEGPGAEAFCNRVTLRDVAKLRPGRVHYTAWCDDEGHVLDDGTLFRFGADRFRLCCQERHLPWLLDSAAGFDVTVAEETEQVAALALQEFEKFDSEAQAKKNIVRAIESVAEKLGNTPSICRKCYVHPAVLDAYLEGTVLEVLRERTEQELTEDLHALQPEEAAVVAMLQQRLRHEQEEEQKRAAALTPPAKRTRNAGPRKEQHA